EAPMARFLSAAGDLVVLQTGPRALRVARLLPPPPAGGSRSGSGSGVGAAEKSVTVTPSVAVRAVALVDRTLWVQSGSQCEMWDVDVGAVVGGGSSADGTAAKAPTRVGGFALPAGAAAAAFAGLTSAQASVFVAEGDAVRAYNAGGTVRHTL